MNGNVHAAVDLSCAQVKLGHSAAVASGGGDLDAFLVANNVETMLIDHERRPLTLLRSLGLLHRLVRGWRPDIIHAHMMTSALLAWPVCKSAGIPLVTTVHNAFQRSSLLMGVGTRVIAVSEAVGRSMHKRGIPSSRLSIVLNGTIGAARFDARDRDPRRLAAPAIIFVGGLHPRKGLLDLFEAFGEVHARNPASRLYIIGDGPYRDEYTKLVSSMDCGAAVTFTGALNDPFPFLLGADIFVLPSHADPAPLVISEAREAGCAVIATMVDGIPELLEHGKAGILVPAHDPKALAKEICALIENSETMKLWKAKSQFNIDYMRIDRVVRETMEVYAIASRKARPSANP